MNVNAMRRYLPWMSALTFGALFALLTSLPALGAERILFSYGLIEISVPIASLETYAKEGRLDRELRIYADYLTTRDLKELRQSLNERIQLSPVTLSQFLYSSMGETSLRYLGEFIQTEAHQNGFYALRAALILSAADTEKGLTLLNILKKFPTRTIRVDAKLALPVVGAFTQLFSLTDRANRLIAQQASIEAKETPLNLPSAIDLQTPGVWTPQNQTLNLYDQKRDRRITFDLYRPPLPNAPVLIVSHGLGSSRAEFADLAQHLASHGFAVVLLEHPGSDRQQLQKFLNGSAREAISPSEFVDRPLDVTYLLDELEKLNRSGAFGQNRLNLQRVGILGHSLGGYTALALAGAEINFTQLKAECRSDLINLNSANLSLMLQCLALDLSTQKFPKLSDRRIQAVFAFNPVSSAIFGQQSLQKIQVPVMFVGGSEDAITPALLEQICPFSWLTASEKYLAIIQGGTHIYGDAQNEALPVPSEFVSRDPAIAGRYLKAMSLAFTKSYVDMQSEYRAYLTASYTQSISQPLMPLRLIRTFNPTELPQSLRFFCSNP